MGDLILHVTSRNAWSAAQKSRHYAADSLAGEGFIHCSKADQVIRVANILFTGQHGLVLLVIDPERLTSELRWEPGVDSASELFPHIYGPINLDAVLEIVGFEPDAAGKFHFPKSMEFVDG
jgi:uncharacterized protein (DUF952 family)